MNLVLNKMPIEKLYSCLKMVDCPPQYIQEYIRRDNILPNQAGSNVAITLDVLNDASLLLFHHYMNDNCSCGLGTWLKREGSIALKDEAVFKNTSYLIVRYKSVYWHFSKNGRNTEVYNLYSISTEMKIIRNKTEDNICLSVHSVNRLSTRFLDVFVREGLMQGIGIITFMRKCVEGAKITYEEGNVLTLRDSNDIYFHAEKSFKNKKIQIITVTF